MKARKPSSSGCNDQKIREVCLFLEKHLDQNNLLTPAQLEQVVLRLRRLGTSADPQLLLIQELQIVVSTSLGTLVRHFCEKQCNKRLQISQMVTAIQQHQQFQLVQNQFLKLTHQIVHRAMRSLQEKPRQQLPKKNMVVNSPLENGHSTVLLFDKDKQVEQLDGLIFDDTPSYEELASVVQDLEGESDHDIRLMALKKLIGFPVSELSTQHTFDKLCSILMTFLEDDQDLKTRTSVLFKFQEILKLTENPEHIYMIFMLFLQYITKYFNTHILVADITLDYISTEYTIITAIFEVIHFQMLNIPKFWLHFSKEEISLVLTGTFQLLQILYAPIYYSTNRGTRSKQTIKKSQKVALPPLYFLGEIDPSATWLSLWILKSKSKKQFFILLKESGLFYELLLQVSSVQTCLSEWMASHKGGTEQDAIVIDVYSKRNFNDKKEPKQNMPHKCILTKILSMFYNCILYFQHGNFFPTKAPNLDSVKIPFDKRKPCTRISIKADPKFNNYFAHMEMCQRTKDIEYAMSRNPEGALQLVNCAEHLTMILLGGFIKNLQIDQSNHLTISNNLLRCLTCILNYSRSINDSKIISAVNSILLDYPHCLKASCGGHILRKLNRVTFDFPDFGKKYNKKGLTNQLVHLASLSISPHNGCAYFRSYERFVQIITIILRSFTKSVTVHNSEMKLHLQVLGLIQSEILPRTNWTVKNRSLENQNEQNFSLHFGKTWRTKFPVDLLIVLTMFTSVSNLCCSCCLVFQPAIYQKAVIAIFENLSFIRNQCASSLGSIALRDGLLNCFRIISSTGWGAKLSLDMGISPTDLFCSNSKTALLNIKDSALLLLNQLLSTMHANIFEFLEASNYVDQLYVDSCGLSKFHDLLSSPFGIYSLADTKILNLMRQLVNGEYCINAEDAQFIGLTFLYQLSTTISNRMVIASCFHLSNIPNEHATPNSLLGCHINQLISFVGGPKEFQLMLLPKEIKTDDQLTAMDIAYCSTGMLPLIDNYSYEEICSINTLELIMIFEKLSEECRMNSNIQSVQAVIKRIFKEIDELYILRYAGVSYAAIGEVFYWFVVNSNESLTRYDSANEYMPSTPFDRKEMQKACCNLFDNYCKYLKLPLQSDVYLEFSNFFQSDPSADCFLMTVIMIMEDKIHKEDLRNMLLKFRQLPCSVFLWESRGSQFATYRKTQLQQTIEIGSDSPVVLAAECVECILKKESPLIYNALVSCNLSAHNFVSRWVNQCFWNYFDWKNVVVYTLMVVAFGVDYQVYACIAVFKHLEKSIIQHAAAELDIETLLRQKIDNFSLFYSLDLMNSLCEQYRPQTMRLINRYLLLNKG